MVERVNCKRTFGCLAVLIALAATASCTSVATVQPAKAEPTVVRETQAPTAATAQWKLFSSQKYGFEFRYPESCKVTELDNSLTVGGRIELSILDAEGLSLGDYVASFLDNKTKNGGWTIDSTKRDSIGGQEVTTVEYRFGGQNRFGTATFFARKAKVYVWGLTAGGFTCNEPEVYGPLLASFRFTD